jgi:hypothetical protein
VRACVVQNYKYMCANVLTCHDVMTERRWTALLQRMQSWRQRMQEAVLAAAAHASASSVSTCAANIGCYACKGERCRQRHEYWSSSSCLVSDASCLMAGVYWSCWLEWTGTIRRTGAPPPRSCLLHLLLLPRALGPLPHASCLRNSSCHVLKDAAPEASYSHGTHGTSSCLLLLVYLVRQVRDRYI